MGLMAVRAPGPWPMAMRGAVFVLGRQVLVAIVLGCTGWPTAARADVTYFTTLFSRDHHNASTSVPPHALLCLASVPNLGGHLAVLTHKSCSCGADLATPASPNITVIVIDPEVPPPPPATRHPPPTTRHPPPATGGDLGGARQAWVLLKLPVQPGCYNSEFQ